MNRLLAVDKPPTCAGEWVMPPGEIEAPKPVDEPNRRTAEELLARYAGFPWDLFEEHEWESVTAIADALAAAELRGYRQAASDLRIVCTRPGGCIS